MGHLQHRCNGSSIHVQGGLVCRIRCSSGFFHEISFRYQLTSFRRSSSSVLFRRVTVRVAMTAGVPFIIVIWVSGIPCIHHLCTWKLIHQPAATVMQYQEFMFLEGRAGLSYFCCPSGLTRSQKRYLSHCHYARLCSVAKQRRRRRWKEIRSCQRAVRMQVICISATQGARQRAELPMAKTEVTGVPAAVSKGNESQKMSTADGITRTELCLKPELMESQRHGLTVLGQMNGSHTDPDHHLPQYKMGSLRILPRANSTPVTITLPLFRRRTIKWTIHHPHISFSNPLFYRVKIGPDNTRVLPAVSSNHTAVLSLVFLQTRVVQSIHSNLRQNQVLFDSQKFLWHISILGELERRW